MIEINSNIDVLIDIDDERWNEWYSPDQWHILIHKIVSQVLSNLLIKTKIELSVLLTNDSEIKVLNKQYRGKDKPTNVLSFPNLSIEEIRTIPINSPYPIMLGDIALAFEAILLEAKTENKTFLHHFYHLVVHGMLHLLGYDHEEDSDAERMQEKEIEILKTLNITDPYQ
jgi:probable rRNA maturation factor